MSRPNKHEYISQICELIATRSTCNRLSVGAIFINDHYEILTTGYNGAPSGADECLTHGCLHEEGIGCIRTIHAEQNGILQAVKHGTDLSGAILYVTHSPCYTCAKLLIGLKIKEVRYKEAYRDTKPIDLLCRNGILCIPWS